MITNDIWTIGNNLMFLTGLRLGKNTYKAKRSEPSRRPSTAVSRKAVRDQREQLTCEPPVRK